MKAKTSVTVVLCMLLVFMLSGCTADKKNNDVKDDMVVFQYGDSIVTKAELYIYINTIKERYESQYGEDVWELSLPDEGGSEVSMVDLTKQEVVEEIIKVKTLYSHSDDYDVDLTEKEIEEINDDAKTFYDGLTEEDIKSMDMTLDKVVQVMTENRISDKVEEKILEKSPIEISDEQARETTFYDMYFECYSIDEDGTIVPYDSEKKRQQYEQALSACSALATAPLDNNEDAESIEKLSEYYKLEHSKEQTLTPEEILETYGEDIYNILYGMKNGDYSTVVESEYGYHVFMMIALTDEDATSMKKQQMTEEAIKNQLSETIEAWKEEIDPDFSYPDSVDMEVYDTISITTD